MIDVAVPSNPVEIGSTGTLDFSRGVDVGVGFAYVAEYNDGLRVIDVSYPSAPVEVGILELPRVAFDVTVVEQTAYVACRSYLYAVDVSTPASPTLIGSIFTGGYEQDVAVAGRYAYVAAHDIGGLTVVDVSDPHSLTLVGTADTRGSAQGVAVSNDLVLVADGPGGVEVFAECAWIFTDGFESGDPSAWSATVP